MIPTAWLPLVSQINGGPIPDGEPGIRSEHAPCDFYDPVGGPWEYALGNGDCDTDGHYLCVECKRISESAFRRARGLCLDCGAKLSQHGGDGLLIGECEAWCDTPIGRAHV